MESLAIMRRSGNEAAALKSVGGGTGLAKHNRNSWIVVKHGQGATTVPSCPTPYTWFLYRFYWNIRNLPPWGVSK